MFAGISYHIMFVNAYLICILRLSAKWLFVATITLELIMFIFSFSYITSICVYLLYISHYIARLLGPFITFMLYVFTIKPYYIRLLKVYWTAYVTLAWFVFISYLYHIMCQYVLYVPILHSACKWLLTASISFAI